jgi:serine/threonine-protein kinase
MVPKLCDFGLARVLPALRDDSARDAVEGTARYMAPELALGHPITLPKAIDAYGLGVVLHDLAHVGLRPPPAAGDAAPPAANSGPGRQATANTVSVLFARSKQGFVVPISPECPPPLAKLLQRCLAVEPTERPESGAVRLSLLQMEAQADGW